MPRPKLTDEQKKENRRLANEAYNKKRLLDDSGEKQTYSEYLEKKGTKQLKLTLTVEQDTAIRKYCSENNDIKPQEYIIGLIKDDLENHGITF